MTDKQTHTEKPSHPFLWIGAIMLLLVAAVGAAWYWNKASSVEQVKFKGYRYVSLEKLQETVKIPKGINPDSLNYDSIKHQMKQIPYVEKVQMKLQPGGTMIIDISERKPVALLMQGTRSCLVDSNGVKLALQKSVPSVPILYGFDIEPMEKPLASDAFDCVSTFLQRLMKNPASNATISAVRWNKKKGVLALTNNGGVKLIFGKDNFRKRLRNWEAFYAQVVRHKGVDHFKSVNMSYKQQIVTHE